jgi:[ribosomal protein S5]-alanine N-acetyltransferase
MLPSEQSQLRASGLTIVTPRVYMRALVPADDAAFERLFADPEVMRFYGDGRTLNATEAAAKRAFFTEHWQQHGFSLGAIVDTTSNQLMGFGGLAWSWWQPTKSVFLSFLLAPHCWGRGLGTEFAAAALEAGFRQLRLERIVATVHPSNLASHRILEKIGMRHTGFDAESNRLTFAVGAA